MQGHQNPNQTKNLNGVLSLVGQIFGLANQANRKKSMLNWLMGLLNFLNEQ